MGDIKKRLRKMFGGDGIGYALLAVSIVSEVFGTTMLKMSEGFTVLVPSLLVVVAYVISFGLFVVEELPMKYMLSNAFFLILSRSVLAPVIGSSFFNNMLYYLQLRGNQRLSETITMSDPVAAGQFTSSLQNAMAQGHSYMESVQVATSSIYSTLQQQSLLLSMKTILGYMLIAALVLAIASAFIPFHKTVKVKIIRTGDDMV